jgi:PrtD family type I secretion system ABC transporter
MPVDNRKHPRAGARDTAPDPIRRVLQRFRGAFIAVAFFGVMANLLLLTMPFYMLNLFSRVMTSRSVETLVMLTIAAVGGLVLYAIVDSVRSRVLVRIGSALDQGLAGDLLGGTLHRAARGGVGASAQQLRDLSELRSFVGGPSVTALFDAPFVPIFLWVIYLMHPALASVALAGSIILLVLAFANERLTRGPTAEASSASGRMYGLAEGLVRNADAVESMGMRGSVVRDWQRVQSQTSVLTVRAAERSTTMTAIAKLVRFLIQIALFAVGAFYFLEGTLAPGAMIAAGMLVGQALRPVEMSIQTWRGLVSARTAYARLKETMGQTDAPVERLALPAPKGRLTLERIIAMAPASERVLLKGVAFDLQPGEFLGVIGPSGAGKTTLARSILGLMPLASGTVRIDGADIRQWEPDALGRYLGYLPQDVQLLHGTVAENIARMTPGAPPEDVVAAAQMAGVHELILRLPKGYDTDIGETGVRLSAGQRQHIGLARAFYGSPVLVVLDEPNANLDSAGEQALLKTLATAHRSGTTLIVVSHRPTILEGADKILMLREGSVELFGPRAEVFARLGRGGSTQAQAPEQGRLPYPQAPAALRR